MFAVHPAQLYNIKYRRRLTDSVIIKVSDQFLQGKDFSVILRTPAQERNKIHNCLRQKSLFQQILKG